MSGKKLPRASTSISVSTSACRSSTDCGRSSTSGSKKSMSILYSARRSSIADRRRSQAAASSARFLDSSCEPPSELRSTMCRHPSSPKRCSTRREQSCGIRNLRYCIGSDRKKPVSMSDLEEPPLGPATASTAICQQWSDRRGSVRGLAGRRRGEESGGSGLWLQGGNQREMGQWRSTVFEWLGYRAIGKSDAVERTLWSEPFPGACWVLRAALLLQSLQRDRRGGSVI